jgi:hypothetical protein
MRHGLTGADGYRAGRLICWVNCPGLILMHGVMALPRVGTDQTISRLMMAQGINSTTLIAFLGTGLDSSQL